MNCAHVSRSANSLVTGDDFGLVKLFDFPVEDKYVSSYDLYLCMHQLMILTVVLYLNVTVGKIQTIRWSFCTCYKREVLP